MTATGEQTALGRVLAALDNADRQWRQQGGQYTVNCPAHDDARASMTIRNGDGKALVHCHAGCSIDQILGALGLAAPDLFDKPQERAQRNSTGYVTAEYEYIDEQGKLLFVVERRTPKTFRQRRPDGRGGWIWSLGDTRRVAYRLPQVIAAVRTGQPIYVVEGEKDVHAIEAAGAVATCNPGGAGKWRPEYGDVLHGAAVVVVADRDAAGRKHAQAVYDDLVGKAVTVRVVQAASGKDVSDHLAAGLRLDDLAPLTSDATPPPNHDPGSGDELHRGQLRFAERFAHAYNGKFLHAHGIGWHQYDGTRWATCNDGAESRAVVSLVKAAVHELGTLPGDARTALFRDITRVESATGINGVLEIASTMHPCTVAARAMDADPYLLNTRSGTAHLDAGTVSKPNPADHLSKVTHARFDPDARSPLFDKFLERIQPNPDNRAFLARQVGSALLGKVRDHVLLIWYGTGANGKGTLRDAIRHALGDYAVEVPADILLLNKHGQQGMAPERMRLKGARVAFCSEIAKDAQLDEATMKKLTGGDPVNAKLLYRNPIEFDPTHTLFMLTNHLPKVRGDDPATWRRILAMPFGEVIPASERDGELPEKLEGCADAILAWLWQGWLDYQRQGLSPPADVLAATRAYQHDMDVLARFVADESVVWQSPRAKVRSSLLYQAFVSWCAHEGEEVSMTNQAFTKAMEKRGHKRTGGGKAVAVWEGLGLVLKPLSGAERD